MLTRRFHAKLNRLPTGRPSTRMSSGPYRPGVMTVVSQYCGDGSSWAASYGCAQEGEPSGAVREGGKERVEGRTGSTSSLPGPSPTMSSPFGLSGLAARLANTPSLPCPPPNTLPPAAAPAPPAEDDGAANWGGRAGRGMCEWCRLGGGYDDAAEGAPNRAEARCSCCSESVSSLSSCAKRRPCDSRASACGPESAADPDEPGGPWPRRRATMPRQPVAEAAAAAEDDDEAPCGRP